MPLRYVATRYVSRDATKHKKRDRKRNKPASSSRQSSPRPPCWFCSGPALRPPPACFLLHSRWPTRARRSRCVPAATRPGSWPPSSGDLTIRNVSRRDAVDFSVELVDTEKRSVERVVTLVVRRHLQMPSVRTLFTVHLDGGCWVGLDCLSPDSDANLSWTLEPPLPTAYAMADPTGKGQVLLASLASRDSARFTCTSSRKAENVSDSVRVACVTATEPRPRSRNSLFVLAGIVSGGLLVGVALAGLTGAEKGSPDVVAAVRRHPHPPPGRRQADQEDGSGAKKEDDG
ncbi:uncharacterized protein si:cabz01074946.1 isoform X2 [Hippocampus zosterae]|uniref:uncharacterized protein si:cabz01074946.1 isoform X2 n=1 Tax=Hippocampus zosterae TaxID=109293 RepID=UPI00223D452A|nr:uncharacterized protein si:cabz01074946.1 isoform X2 [Hippocampus zosterae]